MIKVVIFDMNGVIIDDEHIHELAFKEVLQGHGVELNHQEYLELFAGRTDKEGFEEVSKRYHLELPIDSLLAKKMQVYLALFPTNKKAFPGVLELIKELAIKFTLALTTSSTRQEAELITNEFNVRNYFSQIVSAEDVSRGKPDPEPYRITSEKMGVEPSECIVIEDSATGVAAAKAAGMRCLAITTTHTLLDLQAADRTFDTFQEILDDIISTR